jgi:hypothetical protein
MHGQSLTRFCFPETVRATALKTASGVAAADPEVSETQTVCSLKFATDCVRSFIEGRPNCSVEM